MTLPSGAGSINPRYEECLRLHGCWGWFILLGFLLMVVGAVAMSATFVAGLATVFYLGFLLLGGGVVQIVNAFVARSWGGFFLHLLSGMLHVIVGLLMIEQPLRAAAALTLLLAAVFTVGGELRIMLSLLDRFAGWGWVLINGVIALLLGIAIWRQWPDSTEWVIGLFVGIDMLFNGWSWIMLGLLVKDAGREGQQS